MAERCWFKRVGKAFLFLLAFELGVFSSWIAAPGVFAGYSVLKV